MSGEVVHFEIPADKPERARKFYAETFGWKLQHMPEFEYTLIQTCSSTAEGAPKNPGNINGGMGKRGKELDTPVITISVDEITDALQLIEKNGGKVVQSKQPIGDGAMGFTGYFKDTEGNTVGLWQRGKT
jgi:predicted enzyme related to lactoylglutathione lyase